jgi:signal transduction histidine kinase
MAWSSAHAVGADLAIASMVVGTAFLFEMTDQGTIGESLDAVDVAAGIVAFVLIALRRHAPLTVLGVAVAGGAWSLTLDDDQGVLRAAACLGLYTVATRSGRRTAWFCGAVGIATFFVTAAITTQGSWFHANNLELIAWPGAATAIGDAVRSRRDYLVARQERATALEERAERAEQALEEEARRQVVEERLRIARELHDVVAHHIAVINVQAGVATHLVREDPEGAAEALGHVRRGAVTVLGELSSILSVMRRPDDAAAPTDPLPTLDQVDRLIADFATVGLEVEWHTSGVRRPLGPAVALTAYRIIQESLTNAHRHGRTPRAVLRVDYQSPTLTVDVLNDVAADRLPCERHGHGLVGMRERVAAAGGTIEIGPTTGGRFHVHAVLPLAEEDR